LLRRFFALSSLLVATSLTGCASDDPEVERRGGDLPPEEGSEDWCTRGSGEPVAYCDVQAILHAKCKVCHQAPPLHGAPVPLLTYEDTQQQYYTTDRRYPEMMLKAIESDFMPLLDLNGTVNGPMPPAEPLTAAEKETLLTWLRQCAPPTGGTDCP
jgi:hypothetical protein